MKSIEYLVSTMNKNNEKFVDAMNIKDNVIIINQTEYESIKTIERENQIIKFISVKERGLSKSRNKAIENSSSDICVLSDDDFKYYEDSSQKILEAYEKHKDADMIVFYYHTSGRQQKKFNHKAQKVNYLNALKICSAQITFKRKSIVDNNIKFKEDFGAGTEKYKAGEESIFLYECLKKGLKIYIEPVYILRIEERDNGSAWFEGYNKRFFITKGAAYYQMTPMFYWILILQFAIRKRKIYRTDGISTRKVIASMFESSRQYKKEKRKNIYMLGDFISDTGPAIVNKNYAFYLEEKIYFCMSNNKIRRMIDLIIKLRKCEVILISGLSKFQLLGCNIAKMFNKKVIYLMHGYTKIEYEVNEIEEKNQILKEVEEKMLMKVDKIICVSQRFSELLKKERPDLQNKIYFVNNGIEVKQVQKEKKEKEMFTVISVGGGMKIKNNLSICKAINEIKDIDIKFTVIGNKDKEGEKIEKYNFVEYYENLKHNEVMEKMQQADLYIQNSYFETFGLAIFEAISEGCKILISKNVGALSIIDNIEDDMIINNNEDIEEIKMKIRKAYVKRNKKINYIQDCSKYSWSESAKKLLNLCVENKQ